MGGWHMYVCVCVKERRGDRGKGEREKEIRERGGRERRAKERGVGERGRGRRAKEREVGERGERGEGVKERGVGEREEREGEGVQCDRSGTLFLHIRIHTYVFLLPSLPLPLSPFPPPPPSSCKSFNNLNSFLAVTIGLMSVAVTRLRQTWKEVPLKLRTRLEQFQALTVSHVMGVWHDGVWS